MSGNSEMNMMARELSAMERKLKQVAPAKRVSKNVLSDFSYYESRLNEHSCYITSFLPNPSEGKFTKPLIGAGDFLFAQDFSKLTLAEFEIQLGEFLSALNDANLGIKNYLFFMKDFKNVTAEGIKEWYESLYVKTVTVKTSYCEVVVVSSIDPTYEKTFYMSPESDGQKALDTMIFFKETEAFDDFQRFRAVLSKFSHQCSCR